MSQKTSRKTVTVRTSSVASNVLPDESFEQSDSFGSTSSRLTRSRVEEKQRLSGLNDRLAGYIEKVRNLEQENERLQATIREVEVTEKRVREDKHSEWKDKVDELRQQLETANQERARADMEKKKAANECDDIKAKFGKLERDLKNATNDRDHLGDQVNDLKADNKRLENLKNKYLKERDDLKRDVDEALGSIENLKQQIEDEFLIRNRLTDENSALREDIEMLKRLHENELEDVYKRKEVELTTVQRQYDHKVNDAVKLRVKQLREDFDVRLRESRQEVEAKWHQRLEDALKGSEGKEAHVVELRESNSQLRRLKKEFEDENARLKRNQEELQFKVKDLEGQLRLVQEKLKVKDEQNEKLKQEVEGLRDDYQDLLDIKVQLDNELATYHELLQSEETRLKIRTTDDSQDLGDDDEDDENGLHVSFNEDNLARTRGSLNQSSRSDQGSARRGVKRRRLQEESYFEGSGRYEKTADVYRTHQEAKGDVVIGDVDEDGRFVKLENKGDEDIVLGGWIVEAQDNDQIVTFKFHSRQTIKAGQTATIWSANLTDRTNEPGSNLTLKNQQWPRGDERRIRLVDLNSEEQALYEKFRRTHAVGDANGEERCSIM